MTVNVIILRRTLVGPNTAQIASGMVAYDPDAAWQPANKPTVAAQK